MKLDIRKLDVKLRGREVNHVYLILRDSSLFFLFPAYPIASDIGVRLFYAVKIFEDIQAYLKKLSKVMLPHHITYAVSSIYFPDFTILNFNIKFEFWVILGVGREFLYDSCAFGVHRSFN